MQDRQSKSSVRFFFEKARLFRVIHADGALGGPTPTREIFMALYNQRIALPKEIEQRITPEGKLGEELDRVGKDGIFREMEVGVVMSAQVAEEMGKFLLDQARLVRETSQLLTNESERKTV